MEHTSRFKDLNFPNDVCKLNQCLYDLKQALRAWFEHLSQFFLHLGFICNKVDPSLFIVRNGTLIVLMLVYVDDVVIIGNNDKFIADLVKN